MDACAAPTCLCIVRACVCVCVCGFVYGTESRHAQIDDGQRGAKCAGDDQLCAFLYVGCFIDDGGLDLQEWRCVRPELRWSVLFARLCFSVFAFVLFCARLYFVIALCFVFILCVWALVSCFVVVVFVCCA